MEIKILKH